MTDDTNHSDGIEARLPFATAYLEYLRGGEFCEDFPALLVRWVHARLSREGLMEKPPRLLGRDFQPFHSWRDEQALDELAQTFYLQKLLPYERSSRAEASGMTPGRLEGWLQTVFTNFRKDLQGRIEDGTNPSGTRIWRNLRSCLEELGHEPSSGLRLEHPGEKGTYGRHTLLLLEDGPDEAEEEQLHVLLRSLPEATEVTVGLATALRHARPALSSLLQALRGAAIQRIRVETLVGVLTSAANRIGSLQGPWLLDNFAVGEDEGGLREDQLEDESDSPEQEYLEKPKESPVLRLRRRLEQATHYEEDWRKPDEDGNLRTRKIQDGTRRQLLEAFDFTATWKKEREDDHTRPDHGLNLALAAHMGIKTEAASRLRKIHRAIFSKPEPNPNPDPDAT